ERRGDDLVHFAGGQQAGAQFHPFRRALLDVIVINDATLVRLRRLFRLIVDRLGGDVAAIERVVRHRQNSIRTLGTSPATIACTSLIAFASGMPTAMIASFAAVLRAVRFS